MPTDCCSVYNGFDRDCSNSTGGLRSFRAISGCDIETVTFDESTCMITGITLAENTSFAKYPIAPESSNFEVTQTTDRTVGFGNYETSLTVIIPKMTGERNCEMQKFDGNDSVELVQDNNYRWWLLGWDTQDPDNIGMWKGDSTTAQTGTALTDLNGYTLNLIHYTDRYPYEVSRDVLVTLGILPAPPTVTPTNAVISKKATKTE